MKALFIAFNQAYHEFVVRILNRHLVKGYTYWDEVRGAGSNTGVPHMGSHTWPTLNGSILAIVPEEKIKVLLRDLRTLDEKTPEQGLRAFVWNIEENI